MAKKKQIKQESATPVMVDETEIGGPSEEDETYTDLSNKLAEIRQDKGIIGYILRSTSLATINLKEPEKIVEFAIFSSQVLDSSQEISELFEIGDVESVLVEGKEINALCMDIEGNKFCIFMEKNANHAKILKKVSP